MKNIDELRQYAIETLKKLSTGKITTEEAGVTGKLCESVISTVKVQLEYAKMLKREPKIPFVGECTGKLIESTTTRKLLGDT